MIEHFVMSNAELASAIDYARLHVGSHTEAQKAFTQHVKDLLAVQKARAERIEKRQY